MTDHLCREHLVSVCSERRPTSSQQQPAAARPMSGIFPARGKVPLPGPGCCWGGQDVIIQKFLLHLCVLTRASSKPSQILKFYHHREGPYQGLLLVESAYYSTFTFKKQLRHIAKWALNVKVLVGTFNQENSL